MKILALASYPIELASTRYRLSQFVQPLHERGISLKIEPFLDARLTTLLYSREAWPRTALGLMGASFRRLGSILRARNADLLFVQREAMIFGPPIFEWLAMRLGRCQMVLDLDDATYVSYVSPTYGRLVSSLKWFSKTDDLIHWASVVTCGNRTIAEYVKSKGKEAVLIPTVVDTNQFRPRTDSRSAQSPVIGWVGTHSTFQYLETLFPALQQLAQKHSFRLKIVGAGRDLISVPGVEVENLKWSLEREIADFQSFDIGLYPVIEDNWSIGKSGFKSIQYMSVGIPFVASPVGATAEIGEPNVTHFLAQSSEDWVNALERLLVDEDLRRRMGAAGRAHALEHYTVSVQAEKLAETFRSVVRSR